MLRRRSRFAQAGGAGRLRATLEKSGTTIGPYDLLIVGQALARGLTFVTANASEFRPGARARLGGLDTFSRPGQVPGAVRRGDHSGQSWSTLSRLGVPPRDIDAPWRTGPSARMV